MKFSLALSFCDTSHYLPVAKAADACGFDGIAVADGLFFFDEPSTPYPYTEDGSRFWTADTPFPDPLTIIAAMAAVTERIQLYPNVLKLAVRDPLLVAKALSTAAVISDDRVALGVGLSPWPEDFEILKQQWDNRGPRSAEMVEIIRGVMRGDMFEHHGKYYDIPRLQISPVPKKEVPIYIGGLAEPVLKRAARIGDGYLGWISPKCSFDDLKDMIQRLHRYRDEYGNAGKGFEIKVMVNEPNTVETVERYRTIGVTDLIILTWLFYPGESEDIDHKIESCQRYANDIIAQYH